MRQRPFILIFSMLLLIVPNAMAGPMSWKAWIGYKKPQAGSFEDIACFRLGTQNLSESQLEIVKLVAKSYCLVMSSDEFENAVKSRSWKAACSENNLMSGGQLYKMLEDFPTKFSIYFSKPFMATGQSHKQKARIAIHKNRIEKWKSGDKEPLINTFAHEVTHLVSARFSDDGWNATDCTKSELVTYGIGQLVADIALGSQFGT